MGCTATVWLHLALSLTLAAPCRALLPLWTGEETTEPRLPVQVHGERPPDSNPALVRMLAASALPGSATAPASARAALPRRATRRRLGRPRAEVRTRSP